MNNDLLNKVIECTSIRDVYMEGGMSSFENKFDPKVGVQKLSVQYKIGADRYDVMDVGEEDERETILRVHVTAGVRFVGDETEDEHENKLEDLGARIKAEIVANFVAEYSLNDKELSKEALSEFSVRNASFHVWPYWREYLHSMTGRMRLPEVVLPMFQLQQKIKESNQGE